MNLHLSHEQLCDLIVTDLYPEAADDSDVIHEHLRACLICSAELKSLRDSLSLFRDASVSYAHQEFARVHVRRSSIAPPQSFLTQPLYWAAAVLVIVAALFPLSMRRQPTAPPVPSRAAISSASVSDSDAALRADSDAALLADIDQTISSDVPAPMEALANPTAGSTSDSSTQRKN
jgi:hypothetical protein